ncbi:MAG: TonB-dependent receptor [Henriciella sp.]|uniref:TonB-dependent receptor domain-containing protein n=1 Tax=Henriciella sp. TaxID=1968823 RepID=UPI0032EDBF50
MTQDNWKKKLLATTLFAGVAGGIWAGAAIAQEADPAPAAEEEEDADPLVIEEVDDGDEARQEKVVVTGSRIARDSFTSTAPLQVVTAETIREAGLVDVGEILKTTSVVTGAQLDQTVTTSGFLGDGGPGGASVGLRGLDPERTLVLVNGRRYAPAGVEGAPSFPDISLIPSSIISRIDVLLDGASSVYGSDAVAGVVNVILRDEYDGFNVEAFRSDPIEDGGEQSSFNFILGSTGDRGSFMFSGEYVVNEPMMSNSRDWMQADDGTNCLMSIDVQDDGSTTRTCDLYQAGIGIVEPAFALFYGLPGTSAADSDLDFGVPGLTGIPNFVNGRGDLAESPNGWSTWTDYPTLANEMFQLTPQFERTSLYLSAKRDVDILGGMELFTEFSFSNRQTRSKGGYNQFTAPVPATNPFNPFGVNAEPGTFADAFGPQDASLLLLRPWQDEQYVELDQYRLIGGARGDFEFINGPWDYEVFGGYTRSQGYSERTGVNEVNLALSTYTTFLDPADNQYKCGLQYVADDPDAFGGFFGLDAEECVPINFFSPTLFSSNPTFAEGQRAVDYLRDVRTVSTFVDELIFGGYVTGTVANLPAGEMKAVLGAEWREDSIDTRSDSVAQRATLDGFFFDRPTRGSVNLGELYGELYIPILADQPGVENFDLELAGRFVNHEFYGENSTYSVKSSYSPVEWLTFRGTYGTSFRAPNLRELFLEGQSSFETATDPCEVPVTATAFDPVTGDPFYDPTGDTRDQQIIDNCAAEGLDPTSLGLRGGATSFQAVNAGNTGLDPEESTAWSYGFVFEQPFTDAFDATLGVNVYEVEIENTVFTPSLSTVLGLCYTSDNFPNDAFCTRRQRDPNTGFLTEVDATPFNVAARTSAGVDINASFGKDFTLFGQPMQFDLDVEATKSDEISVLITLPGSEPDFEENVGEIGFPEWRGVVRAGLDIDNVSLFWQSRYIGEQEDVSPPSPEFGGVDTIYSVDEYWVSDFSVSYNADTYSLRAGVQNLFNEEPPQVDSATTGLINDRNVPLGVGYDLFGRRIFVSVAKSF